jgi:hypothetical protein
MTFGKIVGLYLLLSWSMATFVDAQTPDQAPTSAAQSSTSIHIPTLSTEFVDLPGVPKGAQVTWLRPGQRTDIFYNNSTNYHEHISSVVSLFTFDAFVPKEQDAHYNHLTINQPSYNWGNHGGWGVQKNSYDEILFNSRGIAQTRNVWCEKHAVGDTACGDYLYGFTDGGNTAQSDEGFTMDTREGGESDRYFHGTVGGNASVGTMLLPVVFTSGQKATTDGAFMLDISKGTVTGTIVGPDAIVAGTSAHTLPVSLNSGTVQPSTGIGIIQTPLPVLAVANVPESSTLRVKGSFTKGIACLAGGWYPEQVMITAVAPSSDTSQSVTLIHKNPNPSAVTDPGNPSSLWQGGLCGNYLSLDRNLARDGFRTSYPVVGATDSAHIAYVWNSGGTVRQNGVKVYLPPTAISNLVRKNGVVTANFTNANSPYLYNHAPSVVIAGADDRSFNGTVSTPVYTKGQNGSLTWRQVGPDAAAAAATIDLPADNYGFHLYPGAEILAPQTANGVPLEPNSVSWSPGDVIENPHNPSFLMNYRMTQVTQHTPSSGADSNGEIWGFRGAGISANFRPSIWVNDNPCKLYVGCGGTLDPIVWTIHRGPYGTLHYIGSSPMNGGALFQVGCDVQGCDHQSPYTLFELQNGKLSYDPSTSTFSTGNFSSQNLTARSLSVGAGGLHLEAESGYFVPTVANKANWDAAFAAIPSKAGATVSVGDANVGGKVACASGYTCTAGRGRLTVVAAPAPAAGRIAHVQTQLAAGQICTATQNGGTLFFGIGSGAESAVGFDITAGVAISGTVVVDYACR